MFLGAVQYNKGTGCDCDHSTTKWAIENELAGMKDQVRLSMAFEDAKTPLEQAQAMRMAFEAKVQSSLR